MPNNLDVKEMLLTSYFDTDKVKYQKEIAELGTELYDQSLTYSDEERGAYLRGQTIGIVSKTFAAVGDMASAEQWASEANYLMHAQEFLFTQFTKGKDLLTYFRFANHWFFKNLYYVACRIANDEELSVDGYGQELFKTLSELYEVVYPDGDMEFEMLAILCNIHRSIAEDEATGNQNEDVIQKHLKKAMWYAKKSLNVNGHKLPHPLVRGIEIYDAPIDNRQVMRTLKTELMWDCFKPYHDEVWFVELEKEIDKVV